MQARRGRSHYSGVSNRCQVVRSSIGLRDLSNLRTSAQWDKGGRGSVETPMNLRNRPQNRLPDLSLRKSTDNAYGLQQKSVQAHRRAPSRSVDSDQESPAYKLTGPTRPRGRFSTPIPFERKLDTRSYSFIDKKSEGTKDSFELSPSGFDSEDRYQLKKSSSNRTSFGNEQGNNNSNRLVKIRSFMRQRYEKRNNLTKVFLDWDQRCKGRVNADDVKNMIGKMGMNITNDEAHAIVTAADQKGAQELNHQDFFKLITGSDDNIDLYLRSVGKTQSPQSCSSAELRGSRSVTSSLATDLKSHITSKSKDEEREMKATIIKNQIRTATTMLQPKFVQADRSLSGGVDFGQFKSIISTLKIPSSIADDKTLKYVYNEYANGPSRHIPYESFLKEMKNYDCHLNDDLKLPNPHIKTKFSKFYDSHRTSLDSGDSPSHAVLDHNKVTQNRLERIEKNVSKVSKVLKAIFRDKDKFEKALKAYSIGDSASSPGGAGDDGGGDNSKRRQQITLQNLQDFCQDSLAIKKVDHLPSKEELDGFMSAFNYDKHRNAQITSVSDMVFSDGLQQHLKLNDNRGSRFKPYQASTTIDLGRDDMDGRSSRLPTGFATREVKTSRSVTKSGGGAQKTERAREIIQELEEKVYDGHKQKQFDVYRAFDVDNDGFVSRKDLKQKMKKLNIRASDHELTTVFDILDPDRSGFMDFNEFSRNFRPNLAQEDRTGKKTVTSSIEPSSELIESHLKKVSEYSQKEKQKRKLAAFQSEKERVSDFLNANRFKHSPPNHDTFGNLYAGRDTSAYIDDKSRFDRGDRLSFQREDAQRKRQIHTSRVNRIRENRSRIDGVVRQRDQTIADKDFYKINKKSSALFLYDSSVPLNTE